MLTDKKGKLFGKFNIIDALIVLVVLIAIFATVYKFGFSQHKDATITSETVECVFKVENIRMYTVNAFEEGATVYDEETSKNIGTIKKIDYEPSMQYLTKNDGTVVKNEMPERYNAYITVECPVRVTNEGYFLNGSKQITAFSTLRISTNKAEVIAKTYEINTNK